MKQLQHILLLAGLLSTAACNNEVIDDRQTTTSADNAIQFIATLQENAAVETRANIGAGEDGSVVPLPYINGFSIRKVQPSVTPAITLTPYNVLSGNKGVLEYKEATITDCMKWDKAHLEDKVDFYAWTTPTGVTIQQEGTAGTVDFVTGNKPTTEEKDKLNGAYVTPLEVFVSASSFENVYDKSPSVTLPFFHPVSKVSIYLRDWNGAHIDNTTNAKIEFFSIPPTWEVKQTESNDKRAFHITGVSTSDANNNLELAFKYLSYDTENGYFTLYLPPLMTGLGTDFTQLGDFCITVGSDNYYGNLSNIKIDGTSELKAGQHMSLVMDLNKNYGVGVGAWIEDWKGPDKEDPIYANPRQGIYSLEGWKILAAYLKSNETTKTLPDSLFKEESGQKVIRLYNNLTLTADLASCNFSGLTLDGQGHTITLPVGATTGLFGIVGDDAATSTTIQNLTIIGEGNKGNGLLAASAKKAAIENCHITEASSISNTDVVGGLIGTAEGATTLKLCSVEIAGEISGAATSGALVGSFTGTGGSVTNCFAVIGGNNTINFIGSTNSASLSYCYYWNKSNNMEGSFWGSSGTTGTITFDTNVYKTEVNINGTKSSLTAALNAAGISGIEWVYVYGKDHPVIRIK